MPVNHTSIDPNASPAQCPLCGNANRCAIAAGADADGCWCREVAIDPVARARAGSRAEHARCLCPQCGIREQGRR